MDADWKKCVVEIVHCTDHHLSNFREIRRIALHCFDRDRYTQEIQMSKDKKCIIGPVNHKLYQFPDESKCMFNSVAFYSNMK